MRAFWNASVLQYFSGV
uniref:Uncharacterized protein n=1 Tax=Anguilla anguilla TaxID=7936 RepID=A0A0E9W3G5_ANGAN